jgi:hypothetical protein
MAIAEDDKHFEMRIGLDFDNTLVCYDWLFLKLGNERGLLPAGMAADKTAIRNYLRSCGREPDWTAMQGEAYGLRISEAELFPGALGFVRSAADAGHDVFVVSHKTREPFAGPACDLHAAAKGFLQLSGLVGDRGLSEDAVFLEPTKEEKAARIAQLELNVFVDDLPEFLGHEEFPVGVSQILFSPSGGTPAGAWRVAANWVDVAAILGMPRCRA